MSHWRWLVNLVNFKSVKRFINLSLFVLFSLVQVKVHSLEIDLSRRQTTPTKIQNIRMPASVFKTDEDKNKESLLDLMSKAVAPAVAAREIVILNTEKGFVPDKIQLKKGESYKIHIVNVNQREKNTSFLMDSFTQSHNTTYGDVRDFTIEPKVEGIFSYQCPETGAQGKLVVIPEAKDRKPASE